MQVKGALLKSNLILFGLTQVLTYSLKPRDIINLQESCPYA